MEKILIHICCGPCATASVKRLREEGFEVIGYYYNPNIHPNFEYEKRLEEARRLAEGVDMELIVDEYEPREYFFAVKGVEESPEDRCPKCWELRLDRAARKAKELGIGTLATTLRISPYQNQKELLEVGGRVASRNNLVFYEGDLVQCFQESVVLSKKSGMYRQKYCGCIFSRSRR